MNTEHGKRLVILSSRGDYGYEPGGRIADRNHVEAQVRTAFAYIGIKYSWPSVKLSWEAREKSPNAGGLPLYPIKTALMFAFVFLAIQGIAEVIKNIEYLRGHEHRHASDELALAGEFEIEELAEQARGSAS